MKLRLNSIRLKIGLVTSTTILFFGIIACLVTYYLVYNQISTQRKNDYQDVIKTGSLVFEQLFSSSQVLVKSIAANTEFSDFIVQDEPTRLKYLDGINYSLQKFNINNQYSAIYLINRQGITVASTDLSFINQDYSFRQYFQSALSNQPYTDVNYGATSKKLGYYFSYPLKSSQGEIIGVAVIKLDPLYVRQTYNSLLNSHLSDLMLVDRYGVIVESNKRERIYKTLGKLNANTDSQLAGEKKYAGLALAPLQYQPAMDALITQPSDLVAINVSDEVDSDEEIIFISPVPATNFFLVSEISNSAIMASAKQVAIFISIMVAIAAISSLIFLNWFSGILLSPIGLLSRMANSISSGNFDVSNPVHSGDELSTLGSVLETMSVSLKNKYQELEQLVAQRTKKLESQTNLLEKTQTAIQNLLEDTTEAKQAAEFAANDLEKFKKAVDYASDHIVITDPEGTIVYANRAVTKLTGYTLDEVIGKKAGSKDLWGGLMPEEFYKLMWKTIKTYKKTFIGEINNKRKNGQKYIALSSISPILDGKGEVVFYVGIERDATTEREVDRMKTEFVSFASHQLRTPLSAMKWFAEMLIAGDAGKLSKEQLEFVQNIYDSNERMIVLVKDLLDISRIESGRMIIDPVPTDIIKLVKDVLTEVSIKSKAKKQKITSSFSTNLPKINLDPSLIRNVFQNLLTNAIKYTPDKGDIQIFISKKGQNILVQVSDNGYGIPQDQQDQAFQKFFRASNAVKTETEGTGLGLYLVKAVVESSGGKVWFKSDEGTGTTFWLSLPIKGVPKKEGQIHLGS